LQEIGQNGKGFFQSLSKLAEHYNIEPAQTKQFAYPYNMALAMTDVEEKLKSKVWIGKKSVWYRTVRKPIS
jgi:hypothetical protein